MKKWMFKKSTTNLLMVGMLPLLLELTGCSSIGTGVGPHVVPPDRYGLNKSLHLSENQQLLLNIVRVRYNDTPYFLGVSSVTSSFNFNYGNSSSLDYTKSNSSNPFFNLFTQDITKTITASVTPSVAYGQTPTISYLPLQGESFTAQLLTPMQLSKFVLLAGPPWGLEKVIRVVLQTFGPVDNLPDFSISELKNCEVYDGLSHIGRDLAIAIEKRIVFPVMAKHEEGPLIEFHFVESKKNTPEAKRIYAFFKVKGRPDNIQLGLHNLFYGHKEIQPIMPRSVMAIMVYLSKGVEVPSKDFRKGNVEVTRCKDGSYYDSTRMTQRVMRVKFSSLPPENAAVSVYYRKHWFYIAENDTDSKQTLSLLHAIFALLAGDVKVTAPILSLPAQR